MMTARKERKLALHAAGPARGAEERARARVWSGCGSVMSLANGSCAMLLMCDDRPGVGMNSG